MFRELEREDKIFDLPLRKCFFGDVDKDLSVRFHSNTAASPLGPAAGPHSQMAQNIVLSWLVGCRIVELKTVQVLDELKIPRPCIDMATIGFNVEWSQELKIEQSLEEYVKGAMLIEILRASGSVPLMPGFDGVVYDISVGYDLAGIQGDRVQGFVAGMQDASATVDRLRGEIPDEFAEFRDLDFPTKLSNTLTLSTFHGCPPDEIERIIDFLLRHNGLHCTVKLNPLLLGPARTRELLSGVMGYEGIRIPDTAFEQDTRWDQMVEFVDRLGTTADELSRGFGVKFTNTLIVENHRDFFPSSEKEMYLSGPPLHVLAMNLVQKFRATFGNRFPISFAAGIGRENFPDAVALGLVPVTVCTDLLKPGGYGRAQRYFNALRKRMDTVGADSIASYIIRAYGLGSAALARLNIEDPASRSACEAALDSGADLAAVAGGDLYRRWVAEAALCNTDHYVPRATADTRYARVRNSKSPTKVGSHLELFDCITCNKCVPVCPNNANFVFVLPRLEQPIHKMRFTGETWTSRTDGTLVIDQKQQALTW
jgi:putative selenate reductase